MELVAGARKAPLIALPDEISARIAQDMSLARIEAILGVIQSGHR